VSSAQQVVAQTDIWQHGQRLRRYDELRQQGHRIQAIRRLHVYAELRRRRRRFDLGKATAAGTDPFLGDFTGEFKAKGFAVYGVAAAPIDNWVLFGKLGLASTEVEVSATSSVFGAGSDSETKANVAWGLGGGYNFTKNLGARLEWERFRGEFEDEKTDIDLISVGVQYRF
jgi:opacity protein-like surface antigen